MNKIRHNCPVCGKFMGIDWNLSLAAGEVTFFCPDKCKQVHYIREGFVTKKTFRVIEIIDEDLTDKLWEEIDKQNELR